MPDVYPPYIFGMHDRGAEHLMIGKDKRGWVLVTEGVGADPNNHSGSSYTDLSNQGLGVIARLNNGYGTAGTIPHSNLYDDFARRCGNWVQASPGCQIWIIGNEMNLANERPGGPNGQKITPQLYASCFEKCRGEIRSRPGHEHDQVVIGAVGPWNIETTYPGNLKGDWVQYLADILDLLGDGLDGISLHTYTHDQPAHLVFSDDKMQAPFDNRHWHFRAYRDFMGAIPDSLKSLPVYLTETDQYGAWLDANTGWVRNAYQEIDDWNQAAGKQPIQALILYRWIIGDHNDPQQVGWAIENKPGVQDDFRDAMNNEYRVVLPQARPDYRVAWLDVSAPGRADLTTTIQLNITMRNEGRLTWADSGVEAVRLGNRWIDAAGNATEGPRTDLPRPVEPGETVTLTGVSVPAPGIPGYYTLELDLVKGVSGWFSEEGSPVWQSDEIQVGPHYRAAWLQVDAPTQGKTGETVTFPLRVRNEGAFTWPPGGERPVVLTYKWLDSDRNVVVADGLRTPLGREVPPLDEIDLDAAVQFPAAAGQYILQLDMVHEFVAWFQWSGSPVHETQVTVDPAVPNYAVDWLEYVGPPRVVAGQPGEAYVKIQNVGARPWPKSGDEAVRLGCRWLDAQGDPVPLPGSQTWVLPRTLDPGQSATFDDLEFQTPTEPGAYLLVWDLMQGGLWLSVTEGTAVKEQAIQIVPPEYGVAWSLLEPWPDLLPPAEVKTTSLHLQNIGTRLWPARGDVPVQLAYTWFTAAGILSEPWDTFRILLPGDVAPGETVDLMDLPFKTPSSLGDYILRWDLVEEGATWFFRQGGAPLELPVEISEKMLPVPWLGQASHNNDEVVLAFDGNADTFWDSKADQEPGMWFQVDLGQTLDLDRVRVASPGRGFPVGYKIKLSADGQDWHLVAEKAKNWTNIDVAFAPCTARFVRLEQTGQPEWPATWMISEITVSATAAWTGAGASHFADDADQAVDARLRTAWTTRNVKQKPDMWFQVDMGSLRRIERVVLVHPTSQQPRGYVVELSTDGQTWDEVGRKDDNWGMADVQFDSRSARFVRVTTTNSSPYHPWGIAEFVVWRSSPTWLVGRG